MRLITRWFIPMPSYSFAIHNSTGGQVIDPEAAMLADDHEALDLALEVIQDLMCGDDPIQYAGWVTEITEGERIVGRVGFDPDLIGDQRKAG